MMSIGAGDNDVRTLRAARHKESRLITSDTGYVHMPISQLRSLRLVHLISGMDEDGDDDPRDAAAATAITGYTEWIAKECITIGWDWQMRAAGKEVELTRVSEPSSNVMLQNAAGVDLGAGSTATVLETYIDDFNWQTAALEHITTRYRN
jgi:hypothetical protein